MRRTIAALFVICFLFGQTALGLPVPTWEKIGRQALRKINWDWKAALDDWDIQFGSNNPGKHGLTDPKHHCITVWVRPEDSSESVAGTIGHELAHAFDNKYLTPALRSTWLATRGFPADTPWYFPVGPLSTDYLSGAGDFAESVRWTLQGPTTGFRSCLGLRLSDWQKTQVAVGCHGSPPNEAQQMLIRQWLAELPQGGGK
jgi:hypothetical protein